MGNIDLWTRLGLPDIWLSAVHVDSPEHPSLRGPGLEKKQKVNFERGLLFGVAVGGGYALIKGRKYGIQGRELWRAVGNQSLIVGLMTSWAACGSTYYRGY